MNLTIFLFEEIEVFFINFQNNIKKKRESYKEFAVPDQNPSQKIKRA
jgi:hypothetical protein